MVIFHSYVSLSEGRGISLDFTMLKQQTWWFLIGYLVFFHGSYGSWLVDDGDLLSFLRSSTLGIWGMGTLVLNQDVNRPGYPGRFNWPMGKDL